MAEDSREQQQQPSTHPLQPPRRLSTGSAGGGSDYGVSTSAAAAAAAANRNARPAAGGWGSIVYRPPRPQPQAAAAAADGAGGATGADGVDGDGEGAAGEQEGGGGGTQPFPEGGHGEGGGGGGGPGAQAGARAAEVGGVPQAPQPKLFDVDTAMSGEAILKQTGLVRQEGDAPLGACRGRTRCYYAPHRTEKNEPAPAWCAVAEPGVPHTVPTGVLASCCVGGGGDGGETRAVTRRDLKGREELLPRAFIHVMGHVDLARMQFKDETLMKSTTASAGGVAASAAGLGGDPDTSLLKFLQRRRDEARKKQRKEAREKQDAAAVAAAAGDGGGGGGGNVDVKSGGGGGGDDDDSADESGSEDGGKSGGGGGPLEDFDVAFAMFEKNKRKVAEGARNALGRGGDGEEGDGDGDDLHNVISTGMEDGSLLTAGEVAKIIRQYLTRSVVSAARQKQAAIITSDDGDIRTALARGVQAAGVVPPGEYPDGICLGGRIPAVDVRVQSPRGPRPNVQANKWFSHQILVKKPPLPPPPSTDGGDGWRGSGGEDDGRPLLEDSPLAYSDAEGDDTEEQPFDRDSVGDDGDGSDAAAVCVDGVEEPSATARDVQETVNKILEAAFARETPPAEPAADSAEAACESGGGGGGDGTGGNGGGRKGASKGKRPLVKKVPSRVVGVLLGGHMKTTRFDLQPFVKNKWPFLIVEGSGGYADLLASIIKKIEYTCGGHASRDDYQSYLSNYDAATAQVLYEGNHILIRQGMVPEVVTRVIQSAIMGDEILLRAWESYAAWNALAKKKEEWYRTLMMMILVCGMVATAVSILQPFLQLLRPDETDGKSTNGTRKWAGGSNTFFAHTYGTLSIVVVILPITISLMQSVTNKINAGAKWVSLKACAEGLLSEIYLYRTRSGAYSEVEIKRAYEKRAKSLHDAAGAGGPGGGGGAAAAANPPADGTTHTAAGGAGGEKDAAEAGAGGGSSVGQVYATRSELLHVRLKQYTQELVASEMCEENIPEYDGPVPPPEVVSYGDDGFSDLTITQYARLRLTPKILSYNRDAQKYDDLKSFVTLLIYASGALGTAIAALATFEALRSYNIGAWVALTTSIGSALTRYLDYTKSEWLHNKYTAVKHELEGVEAWLSSRGGDGAKASTLDQMVTTCEEKITEEIDEFKQQLKIAVSEAAKEADKQAEERERILESMAKGEQPELVKKMEALGVSRLSSDSLLAALKDPTSADARKLIKTMQRIDDELGGVVEEVKAEAEKTRLGRVVTAHVQNIKEYKADMDSAGNVIASFSKGDVRGGLQDAAKAARLNPLNLEKLLPHDLLETIKDGQKRRKFLSFVEDMQSSADPFQMSYGDLMGTARKCGRQFQKQIGELPYRVAIEGVSKMCSHEVCTNFEDALEKLHLTPLDFVESREQVDEFFSEVKKLASLPPTTPVRAVCAACTSPSIKAALGKLSEATIRSILKRGSKAFLEASPTAELHKALTECIADMDIDVAFAGADNPSFQATLCRVEALTADFPVHFLDKQELLVAFPKDVAEKLKDKSHHSICMMVNKLKRGTAGRRHLEVWLYAREKHLGTELGKNAAGKYGGLHRADPNGDPNADPMAGGGGGCGGAANGKGVGGRRTRLSAYPKLEVLLHQFRNRQSLALAAERLSQIEISTFSKPRLLKRIRNIVGEDELNVSLQQMELYPMQMLLSGVRASVSNGYAGRVFDMLTDELVSFDAELMFSWDDREKLIQRMKDFKGVCVMKRSDKWLRGMLGYKTLVDKCTCLDALQLKELIMRLQSLMASTFGRRVFDKAVEHLDQCEHDVYKEAGFTAWSDQMVDRFVSHCTQLTEEAAVRDEEDKVDPAKDEEWRHGLAFDEPLARCTATLSSADLECVINVVREFAGEQAVTSTYEAASNEIASEDVFHIFDSAFTLPPIRQRLVLCLTNLLYSRRSHRQLHLHEISSEPTDKTLARLREPVARPRKKNEGCLLMDPGVEVSQRLAEVIDKDTDAEHNTELFAALAKVFLGKKRLKEVIEFLLAELKLMSGYRLFLRLCSSVTSFNLREIVKSARARQGFFPAFIKMVWFNRMGFQPRQSVREPRNLVTILYCDGDCGDGDRSEATLRSDSPPTKDGIIACFEEFCGAQYAEIAECLENCTLPQLKEVVGAAYTLLVDTHVGVFFQFHERSIVMGSSKRVARISVTPEVKREKILKEEQRVRERNEGIFFIRHHLRLSAHKVSATFEGFDARLFSSKEGAEKRRLLSQYVKSDDVVLTISNYDEEAIGSLFSYIRSNPAFKELSAPETDDEEDAPVVAKDTGADGATKSPFTV